MTTTRKKIIIKKKTRKIKSTRPKRNSIKGGDGSTVINQLNKLDKNIKNFLFRVLDITNNSNTNTYHVIIDKLNNKNLNIIFVHLDMFKEKLKEIIEVSRLKRNGTTFYRTGNSKRRFNNWLKREDKEKVMNYKSFVNLDYRDESDNNNVICFRIILVVFQITYILQRHNASEISKLKFDNVQPKKYLESVKYDLDSILILKNLFIPYQNNNFMMMPIFATLFDLFQDERKINKFVCHEYFSVFVYMLTRENGQIQNCENEQIQNGAGEFGQIATGTQITFPQIQQMNYEGTEGKNKDDKTVDEFMKTVFCCWTLSILNG